MMNTTIGVPLGMIDKVNYQDENQAIADAFDQVVKGPYSEKSSFMGAVFQMGNAFLGTDLHDDILTLKYDLENGASKKKIAWDLLMFAPAIGMAKVFSKGAKTVANVADTAGNVAKSFKKTSNVVGEMHHIASDKSIKSGFTEAYKKIFNKAGMTLKDPENIIFLKTHKGAHTKVYKRYVLRKLQEATQGLSGDSYKKALKETLKYIGKELIKNPKMPFRGGM